MNSDEAAELYRLKMRVAILERLVLRQALAMPLLTKGTLIGDSFQGLEQYLRSATSQAYQTLGTATGDPAQTALYGDEVERVVEEMIAFAKGLHDEIDKKTKR